MTDFYVARDSAAGTENVSVTHFQTLGVHEIGRGVDYVGEADVGIGNFLYDSGDDLRIPDCNGHGKGAALCINLVYASENGAEGGGCACWDSVVEKAY